MKKIIVIGAGPAGMVAAGFAASKGHKVTLLEKNNAIGRKLSITGKGRCNITNVCDIKELMEKIPSNNKFLYGSFSSFNPYDAIEFFENLGLKVKVERGGRVFPEEDKASLVVLALKEFMDRHGVKTMLSSSVKEIDVRDGSVSGVFLENGIFLECDAIVLATGGLSYPGCGSTGEGHKIAKDLGHTITKLYPSLVPLVTHEEFATELQGLSLKNVALKVVIENKVVYEDFGEMLFTHFGVSGPIILSASRHILGQYAKKPQIVIDLKPALSEKELDLRLLRDFEKYKNKDLINAMFDLLPQKLIPIFVGLTNISPTKKVHEITKEERKKIVSLLKGLTVTIKSDRGFREAIVTAGGISVKEVNPKTMESKIVKNLYFAGEILDVDAYTGGYNLQIAFSTGYTVGNSI